MSAQSTCPCCGAATNLPAPAKLVDYFVGFSPTERRILKCLALSFGQQRSPDQIAAFIYANDPNGGPLNANNSISVMIHRMRPRLAELGFAINAGGRGRYAWHGYRLHWLEAGKAAA